MAMEAKILPGCHFEKEYILPIGNTYVTAFKSKADRWTSPPERRSKGWHLGREMDASLRSVRAWLTRHACPDLVMNHHQRTQ